MHADARNLSTAPADLTPPGGPGLAPAEGGLPIAVMTVRSRASHSKSFGGLIRSYGRGKGLSIAALFNNMPSQHVFPHSLYLETTLDHLGCHLGANRGPFRVQHGPGNGWGGGRRG